MAAMARLRNIHGVLATLNLCHDCCQLMPAGATAGWHELATLMTPVEGRQRPMHFTYFVHGCHCRVPYIISMADITVAVPLKFPEFAWVSEATVATRSPARSHSSLRSSDQHVSYGLSHMCTSRQPATKPHEPVCSRILKGLAVTASLKRINAAVVPVA